MFNKKNISVKKAFRRNCLHCFNSEKVLQEHRKKFLDIDGKQSVN